MSPTEFMKLVDECSLKRAWCSVARADHVSAEHIDRADRAYDAARAAVRAAYTAATSQARGPVVGEPAHLARGMEIMQGMVGRAMRPKEEPSGPQESWIGNEVKAKEIRPC